MRLATFLVPDDDRAHAGEVRGEEVVGFESGTVLDRLASGDRTPATGAAYALGNEPPKVPLVFTKLPSSSVPGSGPVVRPATTSSLDYEVELAVVIGGGGEIAGWAIADDVSARDWQRTEGQWARA